MRKRRYRCQHCGKRFFENNFFLPRYHRVTNSLAAFVSDKLRDEHSFTSVSRTVNISVSTMIRIFDIVSYPKTKLSAAIAIDEFKGNFWGEKYQCILTDPENKIVLDILPMRYGHYLSEYFKKFPSDERNQVKYFISDMWEPYSDSASVWFKNATQIIDKYNWIRQVIWAFERVWKEKQKKSSKTHKIYFKRSKTLLTKRYSTLTDEQQLQVRVMLDWSVNLSRAHWFKKRFLQILDLPDHESSKYAMLQWIKMQKLWGSTYGKMCKYHAKLVCRHHKFLFITTH